MYIYNVGELCRNIIGACLARIPSGVFQLGLLCLQRGAGGGGRSGDTTQSVFVALASLKLDLKADYLHVVCLLLGLLVENHSLVLSLRCLCLGQRKLGMWVVVKIMVPFLGTLNIRCPIIVGNPKRDHNFDPIIVWHLIFRVPNKGPSC